MQRSLIWIPLVVAACLAWSSVIHAGDDDFALSKLAVPGDILELVPVDLDADSLLDIVIFHRKGVHPNESRWVSVFWQAANGTYGTAPDQSWELDTLATVADVGNVDGDAATEICYLTSNAVRYYRMEDRRFSEQSILLFPCTSLTVFPSRDQIPVSDFVRDWDGRHGDEVAVFDFTGLNIYRPDENHRFSASSAMRIELQTRLGTSETGTERDRITGVTASFQFPDITIADWNGDGLSDLIATLDDRLQIYVQNQDGAFDPEPAARIDFDVRTLEEKEDGESELNTVVADLNRDSYADAIITKLTAKGLSNIRNVISLFWGRPEGYPAVPDQVMVSEGSVSATMNLRDVNGDGNLDMILPSLRISITAIIRMLITRNIPVTFNIFLYQEGQKYSDRPDFEKEVKFKIDFSGESDTQAMTLDGDFNGDGVKDFVLATADDKLSIYLGDETNPKELFSKRAVSEVEADAFGELIAEDLNHDGYSDMILHYPNTDKMKGFVEVLMNRAQIQ
ncbi:MAG: hypothetical protein Kow0074_22230 [Candidatus Zixiibacteriota bacterium]